MALRSPLSLHLTIRSWTVLFLLYAYSTLHFGFAVPSIFGFQDRSIVVALHLYSTPIAWKVFAISVWISALLVLFAKLDPTWGGPPVRLGFVIRMAWLLGFLATIWFGSLIAPIWNEVPAGFPLLSNWLEFKGAISAVATWATALVGALSLLSDERADPFSSSRVTSTAFGPMLMCLVVLVAAISLAELWTGLAYASETRGIYLASRASSTLFNPNVLGLWAAFTTIGATLLYCEKVIARGAIWSFCILLAFITLAAGSRSAFISIFVAWLLLIAGLSVGSPSQLSRAAEACLAWTISLTAFFVTAHTGNLLGVHGNLIESLIWNSDRLVGSFSVALVYGLSMLSIVPEGWAVLPESAQMSMDGRFLAQGGEVDNAYLAILVGGGWGVLAVWLSLWLFAAIQALCGFWRTRHRYFAYAVVLIALSGMAGLGMRSVQLFPVSVFVSIALTWALFFASQAPSLNASSVQ